MKMKAQEVFDTVVTHLRSMTHRSFDKKTDLCMYRAPDGNKCAVGCLIPDRYYQDCMEDTAIVNLLENPGLSVGLGFLKPRMDLLAALQKVHDDKDNWRPGEKGIKAKVEKSFKELAEYHKLNYTPRPASA